MNADFIITVYVVIDDLMHLRDHQSHCLAHISDAEVLTVAIIAAKYFQNNHERALQVLYLSGYLTRSLSASRFNRRVHALADWLTFNLEVLTELMHEHEVFIIDSMPIPVCKRKRAKRCRKVRGRSYYGYCAAKDEKFFGWRLHVICTADGRPASFTLLPAAFHDLTPLYELTFPLPAKATLYGDKAYNCAAIEQDLAQDGLRLVPIRKKNMRQQHTLQEENNLRRYRKGVETVNSQLESMGINRLHARTNPGFEIKVHATLIALWNTRFLANED